MRKPVPEKISKPTVAELAILNILWQRGRCTVRDVHEVLSRKQNTGYTTALKLLQVMHDKGLVERDDTQRAHIYRPAMSKDHTQTQLVTDFVETVFSGSVSQLVIKTLGDATGISTGELTEIRRLIERLE